VLVYDEKVGRPKSTRTEVSITAVAELVKNDRRFALRRIAKSLKVHKTVVHLILKENYGRRKWCAHFVPHSLTPEQREDRVKPCQDIIAKADEDKNFLTAYLREKRPSVSPLTRNKATECSE
jgi:hypothetical protein